MERQKTRTFAITISPRLWVGTPRYVHNNHIRPIRRYLNQISDHYCLYPELADATARLHYHGVIVVKDYIKFKHLKESFFRNIGMLKLDPLKDNMNHLRWLCYCMKEWAGNKRLFKEPIMYQRLSRLRPIEEKIPLKTIEDYFNIG